jgi:SAM-dependent methyltransferase
MSSHLNNPWNADKPFSTAALWPACDPITGSMWRKISGLESVDWLRYVAECYMGPALTNWERFTPEERRKRAVADVKLKNPADYRCLILGSNEGVVERFLCEWGFVGEIVATDIAEHALARAKAEACRLGYANIRHVQADLNIATISGKFDFVIAQGVLHHIENLGRCLQMIRSVMPSYGLLFAAEFTGPFRFQLPDEQIYWINHILRFLPRGVRFGLTGTPDDLLPACDGDPYVRPSEESIAEFDASEAISGHLLDPSLASMFDVMERKPLGGTLMTYLHEHLDYRLAGEYPYSLWTQLAIDLESALISRGVLNSDYVFYVLGKRGARSPSSPALSKNLNQRSDNPLWNLETLGTVTEPGTIEVSAQEMFTIRGWAVDHVAKAAAGGIDIVIDGTAYAGEYGLRRPDVAKVHGEPAYLNSGYYFKLNGEHFAPGPHTAFVRVISHDKQSYWQVGPYIISVK